MKMNVKNRESSIELAGSRVKIEFFPAENFCEEIDIEPAGGGYIVTRTVKNASDKVLSAEELKTVITGIDFNENSADDYFYCNENARLFCNLTIPLDYNRTDDDAEENKKFSLTPDRTLVDPGVKEGRICSSPYQPFPAVLISNYATEKGIVCGSLLQDVFYHNFETGHRDGKAFLEIYSSFKGIDRREVSPGEELKDIFFLCDIDCAGDINRLFDKYTAVLRGYLKDNCGKSGTNRHSLVWGSWNDGMFLDFDENSLLKEAAAVKKYFPNTEWFQLDAGYSSYRDENKYYDTHGLGVPYEGESGVDKTKFPEGLKSYTDKIRKTGLKPAIWIGGFCPVKSKIFKEHPEWFIDYTFRLDWAQPLDVSREDVRNYMCKALDYLITECGFDGVKHDFWSYAFEDRHNLLKNKNKSGGEYRNWWLKEIRDRLPACGYLETACDISMGNPFIGRYVNNYRFGDDMDVGLWSAISTTVYWSLASLTTHTGDLFVPNSDSMCIFSKLNDDDFMFIVNFQIITRALVEIAGRFSEIEEDNPRLKVLQRATKYINNGEDVYFACYDYRRKGKNLPEIIYIKSAFDSGSEDYFTVAVFNGGEESKEIRFDFADLGLTAGSHAVEYVWEEKTQIQENFRMQLKPHGSTLLKIKK